jgi:CBS domain-containing protein
MPGARNVLARSIDMTVGELCSRIVVFATRGMELVEAASLMREHHVGSLVVADERGESRVPVGMLTDRDITVGVLAKGVDPRTLRVGEVMSTNPLTIRDQDDVFDALRLMRSRGVRRLPVTDAGGALVGMLSIDDVLEGIAEQLGDLARAIATERTHEATARP